jgi:hypothetical protein
MNKILLITLLLLGQNSFGQTNTKKINITTWKKDYENLPFWNKEIDHAGAEGYIDTFTINKTHFRIVHNDTAFDGTVQVYKGNKWIDNIQFENLGNHNDYDITNDLDGDGNKDLIFYWKWHGEIYFFDKQSNRFSDSLDCTIGRDWTTLNPSKHIYFENQFGKLLKSPVHSNLITFKNKMRIELASLEMSFDTSYDTENSGNLTNCKLFISGLKKSIENFNVTKKVSPDEYDLEKYWKAKLKKILGYSQH